MRFKTRTLLVLTAVVAITLCGYAIGMGGLGWDAWAFPLYMLPYLWFWVAPLFFAFAAGRRELTFWMLVALAVCEATSIGLLPLLSWLDMLVGFTGAPPAAIP